MTIKEVADALFEYFSTEKPEDAEVEKGGEGDAPDEKQAGGMDALGDEMGDDHRGSGGEKEGEHVTECRTEGVADFLIEETVPDACPKNDDEDVGEDHEGDFLKCEM